MKTATSFILFFLLSCLTGLSQECDIPKSLYDITVNEVKAKVSSGGSAFGDYFTNESGFIVPFQPGNPELNTIYTANVWVSGLDYFGNYLNTTEDYIDESDYEWSSGPLREGGFIDEFTCKSWDRLWIVNRNDIEQHIIDYQQDGVVDNKISSIYSWPGLGNIHFYEYNFFELPEDHSGLAPFMDNNNNSKYEPDLGEYPLPQRIDPQYIPEVIVWSVFNDVGFRGGSNGNSVVVEVQSTYYAFPSTDSLINRTIFRSLKVISKRNDNLLDFNVGLWTDFDLGCFEDDYIGCAPELNTYYAYNGDNLDDISGCSGVTGYGDNPPVQAVTILNDNLSSFIGYYNNSMSSEVGTAVTDPTSIEQYYGIMNSEWRNGFPMTYGGNGFNPGSTDTVNFLYPDNPTDSSGWSMASHEAIKGDIRALGIVRYGEVVPGTEISLDVAYSFHQGEGNDNLENVELMYEQIPELIDFYNGITLGVESFLPNAKLDFHIYPNPTKGKLFLEIDGIESDGGIISIFSPNGKIVQKEVIKGNSIDLHVDTGIYFIKFEKGKRKTIRKLVVDAY